MGSQKDTSIAPSSILYDFDMRFATFNIRSHRKALDG